jgi:hypothetical protein
MSKRPPRAGAGPPAGIGSGWWSAVGSQANVMKTAMNLSKLSAESSITLNLKLELKGDVNDHSVQMALREIQNRVVGLAVGDAKGK